MPPTHQPPGPPPDGTERPTTVRVVVVEDDEAARTAFVARLAARPGVEVVAATTRDAASQVLTDAGVDVVVVDAARRRDLTSLLATARALAAETAHWTPPISTPVPAGGVPSDDILEARARIARLSVRETDVLRALADGLPNSRIAARLHLALPTVKEHVSSVLTKLGVDNRVQAAIVAHRAGAG